MAWIAGLRLRDFSNKLCQISVKHNFLTQNPFKSMFWAVQGMAAELSTGMLCIDKIQNSGHKVSMLVIEEKASFTKKAKGKILFTCNQGEEIDKILEEAIQTKEGRVLKLFSTGIDESGDEVSKFEFVWSFKVK